MKASTTNNRSRLRVIAAAAGAAAALAVPSTAGAAGNECELKNGILDVQFDGGGRLQTAGGTIAINFHSGPLTCKGGTPTVLNTEVVRLVDVSDDENTPAPLDGSSTVAIHDPASFAPGRTPEDAPNKSEIEFVINMNGGTDRLVAYASRDVPARWVLGTTGANWNDDPDPDASIGSFEELSLNGSPWDDNINLRGGGAMGAPPAAQTIVVDGGDGKDAIAGSDGPDHLLGGLDNDAILGHGGDDTLVDPAGNDTFIGGPGQDTLDLSEARPAARVDLGVTSRQDTGAGRDAIEAVENVYGSSGDDVIVGNDSVNVLGGHTGNDTFDGKGGADVIHAYDGSDTVVYSSSPSAVNVDLVNKKGTSAGVTDTLYDVENVVGSPFADRLTGDEMANRLVGGAGVDTVFAGAGADRVEVRDGEPDRVSCGDNPTGAVDRVLGDRRGVDVLTADCETLDLVPDPVPPAPVEPAPADPEPVDPSPNGPIQGDQADGDRPTDTPLTFSLSGSRAQRLLARKSVRVQVACPAKACSATVGATVIVPRERRGRRPRAAAQLRLRAKTVALGAGTKRTVVLRLTKAQLAAVRQALAAKRTPTVTVVGTASDAGGNRVERTLRVTGRR